MEIKIVKSMSSESGCTLTALALAKKSLEKDKNVLFLSYDKYELEIIGTLFKSDKFCHRSLNDIKVLEMSDIDSDVVIVDQGINEQPNIDASTVEYQIIHVHDCSVTFDIDLDKVFAKQNVTLLLNKIPVYESRPVHEMVQKISELNGQVLATLHEDKFLQGMTLEELVNAVNGSLIDESVTNKPYIAKFLIGGNIMDSGEGYFGRYENQAVITRGGRPDIQMASIMAGTKCLVLTQDTEPTEYIISEARKHKVPLISVTSGTEDTIELLSRSFGNKSICLERIDRFLELLEQN